MIFNDTRRFGLFLIEKDLQLNTGIEPFDTEFSLQKFHEICQKNSKKNIKNFLIDGKSVAGIGNIYSSEILFESRISPLRKIGELINDYAKIQVLYEAIISVLQKAIEYQGSSIDDYYRMPDNSYGNFQNYLQVYDQKICNICSNKIEKIKQNGRTTHFCTHCQK